MRMTWVATAVALSAACTPAGVGSGTEGTRPLPVGEDAGPPPPSPRPDGTPPRDERPTDGAEGRCDGLDDDRDGEVDEGCPCAEGETQPCWPGDPSLRGMPGCADGTQRCEVSFEFAEWGACMGYAACEELCSDAETRCDDGADDDCDGLFDCADPDCAVYDECEECEESERGDFTLAPICKDGEDNDCDGLLDCDDPDCIVPGRREMVCDDGFDDDCDGLIDCDDPDCEAECPDCDAECIPGAVRWCDEPSYCLWGKQTCTPDGRWGPCTETRDRPGLCSGPIYDSLCCVLAGECCQAFPLDTSIGDCEDIIPMC